MLASADHILGGDFMGYKSDVALVVKNDNFMDLIKSTKGKQQSAYELLSDAMIRRNEKYTTLLFEDEEWYEDNDDIRFIENFICELPHYFIRTGCNYDDIDERCMEGENQDMRAGVSLVRRIYTDNAGECIDFSDYCEQTTFNSV
jgi:hypothetical protein